MIGFGVAPIGSPKGAGPISRSTSPIFNPTTTAVIATPFMVPKLWCSGRSPGIDGFRNAINMLANQHSALPSEIERVAKSASRLAVGKGERGGVGSSVRAREERSKERLKWGKANKLLLANGLPALATLHRSSPLDWDTVISRWFPWLCRGCFFGPLSGVLPAQL